MFSKTKKFYFCFEFFVAVSACPTILPNWYHYDYNSGTIMTPIWHQWLVGLELKKVFPNSNSTRSHTTQLYISQKAKGQSVKPCFSFSQTQQRGRSLDPTSFLWSSTLNRYILRPPSFFITHKPCVVVNLKQLSFVLCNVFLVVLLLCLFVPFLFLCSPEYSARH